MRKDKKVIFTIIAITMSVLFVFALYKSCMSIDQMTQIFDNTKGIGAKLAPSIANDINKEYFLFDKNIFLLIGGFIFALVLGQFLIIKSIAEGQMENFELHHGTRLQVCNKTSLLQRDNLGIVPFDDGKKHD